MQTETAHRRETIRSRATMSYAFEAAVLGVARDLVDGVESVHSPRVTLAKSIASVVGSDKGKTHPTWTVSKRAKAPAKGRRKGSRR